MKEWKDEIVFLRKILQGGTDRSYGIQVARLAGLPREVVARAKEILRDLEKKSYDEAEKHPHHKEKGRGSGKAGKTSQIDLFTPKIDYAFADELSELDILNLTPIQALGKLSELKEKAEKLKEKAGG